MVSSLKLLRTVLEIASSGKQTSTLVSSVTCGKLLVGPDLDGLAGSSTFLVHGMGLDDASFEGRAALDFLTGTDYGIGAGDLEYWMSPFSIRQILR